MYWKVGRQQIKLFLNILNRYLFTLNNFVKLQNKNINSILIYENSLALMNRNFKINITLNMMCKI